MRLKSMRHTIPPMRQTHTRRLRKLYAQADLLTREVERVRQSNPFPEHAPTACRIRETRIRELQRILLPIERAILTIENNCLYSQSTGRTV